MGNLIRWEKYEKEYAKNFSEKMGAKAKPFRMAWGALIIKERMGVSDKEIVEQIRENPYLQYCIGLKSDQEEAPFDASTMVWFRKRIKFKVINKINQEMVRRGREILESIESEEGGEEKEEESDQKNEGKLILDASCAPADIKYPTDLEIVNQARKGTQQILDCLYQEVKGKLINKSRT